MKERPILFSGPMVRAILEDRKTQTRRVVKPQPKVELFPFIGKDYQPTGEFAFVDHPRVISKHVRCPYGKAGDRLWVRETFTTAGGNRILYYATDDVNGLRKKKPAIHMPRSYSRISLEVAEVRVERVQDISEEDLIAEGCSPTPVTQQEVDDLQISDANPAIKELGRILGPGQFTAKHNFAQLWDSINGKRGFGWKVNPWVWAITFKRVQ